MPCIQWFSKIISGNALIEQYENYSKGSYRNRCHIIGGNGIQRLSIPLKSGKNSRTPIREVKISYDEDWQKIHWQSIRSAYGNAPFYEFYFEEIQERILCQKDFLFDYNLNIISHLLELLGTDDSILSFTEEYAPKPKGIDLRNGISPKEKDRIEDTDFQNIEYAQVFLERHGFVGNLSILDLLFCVGPSALEFLE